MKLNEALKIGRDILLKEDIDPREARLLLAFVLQIKIEEILKVQDISEEDYNKFYKIIEKRANGEPFAYLVGKKEFMKLDFEVNSNVLIPREDTEKLVQEVIEFVTQNQDLLVNSKGIEEEQVSNNIKILDMCTGSGCIAISLAKYLKQVDVWAVDVSEEALTVAQKNAEKNEVEVSFVLSDLFEKIDENIDEKFDVIVSNPPYIQTEVIKKLQKEVKKEPTLALDGGESGIIFYEKIIDEAPKYLKDNGLLAFEIGYDQGEIVSKLMIDNGFENVVVKKDLGNQDRVVMGSLRK